MMATEQADLLEVVTEIFPGIPQAQIVEVIQMVYESSPLDTKEQKFENIINIFSGEGAQGPMPQINISQPTNQDVLFTQLISIFSNADENYLHEYVTSKPNNFNIHDAIEELSLRDLPTRNVDPKEIGDQLKAALPNADPSYLQKEAYRLAGCPPRELDAFVQNAIEKNEYPTMQDYINNKKHNEEVATYKQNFDLQHFLEIFPNPVEKFSAMNQKLILDENSDQNDLEYAINFLYNHYSFIRRKYIDILFKFEKKNLVAVFDKIEKLNRSLRKPRALQNSVDSTNIKLLQLIAFLKNRKVIKRELKLKDERYRSTKEEARRYNLLETCQCCYDEELIPEECYFCMKGCVFCKECIQKGVEVGVGNGNVKFPCMSNCNSEFGLHTLQMVLPKKMFDRLAQRIGSKEIKTAKVDGLETCPFCDFAMILPDNEKIFKCFNEDCLKESCRQCRHISHVPLRCNEIEYDEDIKRRTFIENKMTEALTRKCYSCHKLFIKSNGCNKMTCTCKAIMCYQCGQPIEDFSHFGDSVEKCALFTNDVEIDLQRVLNGAQAAKNELGNVEIKFDPTVNIRNYFQ